jgi:hypothetical protein
MAVVNCDAKANWTVWHAGVWRSCRIPLVDAIQADFHGDKAKLEWPISLDGKKKQSETYRVLAILDKAKENLTAGSGFP